MTAVEDLAEEAALVEESEALPAVEPEVETESERVANAHDVLGRYIIGYAVHNIVSSGVDEGGLHIHIWTEDRGLTPDLLNLYNTLTDHDPRLMFDLGKVELTLSGVYEGHRMRFFSIARDEACDALRELFPGLGPTPQSVALESLWAFVEDQESA